MDNNPVVTLQLEKMAVKSFPPAHSVALSILKKKNNTEITNIDQKFIFEHFVNFLHTNGLIFSKKIFFANGPPTTKLFK